MSATSVQTRQACGFTQVTLAQFLEKADKGELKFERYFFTNVPGTKKHPPREDIDDEVVRCRECGHTIGEHSAGSPPIQLPVAVLPYTLVNPWRGHQSQTESGVVSMLSVLRDGAPTCCTVLKQLFPNCFYAPDTLVGAHIIPRRAVVGFEALQTGPLQGWSLDDLHSKKNGIIMAKFLEDEFDDLVWCFVPSIADAHGGLWSIRVFVPDLSASLRIHDRHRTVQVFIKSCSLQQNDSHAQPSQVRDNSPLTYADLNGKEVTLPQELSVSAIMYHAEKSFERHNKSQEFKSLIPAFVAASKRKGSPPQISTWLVGVVQPSNDGPDAAAVPTTAEVVSESSAVARKDAAPQGGRVPVGGDVLVLKAPRKRHSKK